MDVKSQCLFAPFAGHHLPFHLSTIKNVTCSETETSLSAAVAAAAAAGGAAAAAAAAAAASKPSRYAVLRINFQVPGSQTLTQKGEENPLPDIAGKNQLFIKELTFRTEDSRHLQSKYYY